MKKAVKVLQNRRGAIMKAVADNPGVTTTELVSLVGVESTKLVSNAMWVLLKSGKLLAEQITREGRHMNAYYLPEQIGPDSVARVRQKLVDAADVIPAHRSGATPNSVFDLPRATRRRSKSRARAAASKLTPTQPTAIAVKAVDVTAGGFDCAVTNEGSLVLMRKGHIAFSLNHAEVSALESYLMKRAAGRVFAQIF